MIKNVLIASQCANLPCSFLKRLTRLKVTIGLRWGVGLLGIACWISSSCELSHVIFLHYSFSATCFTSKCIRDMSSAPSDPPPTTTSLVTDISALSSVISDDYGDLPADTSALSSIISSVTEVPADISALSHNYSSVNVTPIIISSVVTQEGPAVTGTTGGSAPITTTRVVILVNTIDSQPSKCSSRWIMYVSAGSTIITSGNYDGTVLKSETLAPSYWRSCYPNTPETPLYSPALCIGSSSINMIQSTVKGTGPSASTVWTGICCPRCVIDQRDRSVYKQTDNVKVACHGLTNVRERLPPLSPHSHRWRLILAVTSRQQHGTRLSPGLRIVLRHCLRQAGYSLNQ
jgi:hypothetical protein